jgi:hypothetical protein
MAAEAALDSVLEEIGNHLTFLGYEKEVKQGTHRPFLYMKHKTTPNFLFDTAEGVIITKGFYPPSELGKTRPPKLLSLLCDMNGETSVLKLYLDGDHFLNMEAGFPHAYSKVVFSSFWEAIQADLKIVQDGRLTPFLD